MKPRLLPSLVLFTALLSATLVRAAAAATPAPDIVLHSGEKFTSARITAIAGDRATIAHAGGVVSVSVDQLDLEVLARAKMQLDAEARERAERHVESTRRPQARNELSKEELAERKAIAEAFESAAQKKVQPATPPATQPARQRTPAPKTATKQPPLPTLDALKQRFPAPAVGAARVFIPQSGQGSRPYIISSTLTEIQGGPKIQSTTTTSFAKGRIDSIQYQAPSDDMWRWYKSTFQTTTIEALPRTLQLIEQRMAEDIQKCQLLANALSASNQAQGQHALYWFEKQLKPLLAESRKLIR